MNEDICKREFEIVTNIPDILGEGKKIVTALICGEPKNPEFLYCDDCMREIFDETP